MNVNTLWKAEPVALAEATKLLVGNLIAMLVLFGLIDWTPEQTAGFLAVVNSTMGIILTVLARDASVPTAKLTATELKAATGRKAS
ncbi:MAG: hypothetical protein ACRDHM_07370 [Actinomycetota bacterium]